MRKISFIYCFLLIAVASCTPAEITKDQQGGDDGKAEARTVIGAEIGGSVSKTTLDNPSLEASEYPVYWTQSDKININGIESNGIVISETDRRQANFSFPDPISGDMNAIYPASRVFSYSSGAASVILPSVQTYKNGDFDASTAMMVAKEQAGSNTVRFSNVMAYLQFIPGGGANNISRISVTAIGGEKMSGLFNVDFADKKLVTPSSDPEAGLISTRTASVVCDTPVSAGIPMIVAIPAQVYSKGIMVIIQDTEGHITQASNTANLNFEKGKIYQLSGITFTPSAINASGMRIDGDFGDWLLAPSVSYSLPEGAQYPDVRELKLAADADNVYMYMELFEPTDLLAQTRAMDIHIDADADHSTGCDLGSIGGLKYFNGSGLEWYIEPNNIKNISSKEYKDLQGIDVYKWAGPTGAGVFAGYLKSQNGAYGTDQIMAQGDYNIVCAAGGGNIGRYEVKLNRRYFGIYGNKVNLGVKYMEPGQGWPIRGLLPQGKPNGGSRTVTDMAALALASTAYPVAHIDINGNYEDWDNLKGWTSECIVLDNSRYSGMNSMKVTADGDFVYLYFDFAHDNGSSCTVDFFIDSDANAGTGLYTVKDDIDGDNQSPFSPFGAEWYVQTNTYNVGNYFDFSSPGYFLEYKSDKPYGKYGGNTINYGKNGSKEVNSDVSYAQLKRNGEGALMEWKISRSLLKLSSTKASFGLHYQCPGYTTDGICPQNVKDANGKFVPAPMLKVTLPPKNNN